jgi:hypothetical protein
MSVLNRLDLLFVQGASRAHDTDEQPTLARLFAGQSIQWMDISGRRCASPTARDGATAASARPLTICRRETPLEVSPLATARQRAPEGRLGNGGRRDDRSRVDAAENRMTVKR